MKTILLASTLFLGLTTAAVAAAPVAGPADVQARLQAAGYAQVRDIEFDDGLWEAEVRDADGRWHDVAIAAADGEILDDRSPRPLLTATQAIAALEAAGYSQVGDLDLDDAVWEADAVAAGGRRVELRLNGHSGAVLSESDDD